MFANRLPWPVVGDSRSRGNSSGADTRFCPVGHRKGGKQLLNTSAGLVRLLATKIDRARSSGSLEPGSARRNQRTPCIELANAGIFHVTVRAGLIGAYHAASARIMQIYGGFLAEFRGDGILAYFGYP